MNSASGRCRVSFCLFHVLLVLPINASRCPSAGWAEPVCRAKSNQLRRYFFYSCKTWQCLHVREQFLGGARMVWPQREAKANASRPRCLRRRGERGPTIAATMAMDRSANFPHGTRTASWVSLVVAPSQCRFHVIPLSQRISPSASMRPRR